MDKSKKGLMEQVRVRLLRCPQRCLAWLTLPRRPTGLGHAGRVQAHAAVARSHQPPGDYQYWHAPAATPAACRARCDRALTAPRHCHAGTIGHVAHGKSTVVKAISGVQARAAQRAAANPVSSPRTACPRERRPEGANAAPRRAHCRAAASCALVLVFRVEAGFGRALTRVSRAPDCALQERAGAQHHDQAGLCQREDLQVRGRVLPAPRLLPVRPTACVSARSARSRRRPAARTARPRKTRRFARSLGLRTSA